MVWIPRTTAELLHAIASGTCEETPELDFKRALPERGKKTASLATDVAAMSTDGGVLIYGVGEDEDGAPTTTHPIEDLRAERDRFSQIVAASIAGPPQVTLTMLTEEAESNRGYLVAHIPASPLAPHQVLSTGQFYGRHGTHNRVLTAAEIDRLYERRQAWAGQRAGVLERARSAVPAALTAAHPGFLVLTLSPAGAVDALARYLGTCPGRRPQEALAELLSQASISYPNGRWSPHLSDTHDWHPSPGGGWRGASFGPDIAPIPAGFLSVRFDADGTITLICGRATEQTDPHGLLILEGLIAGLSVQLVAAGALMLERIAFAGPVDLGIFVGGLESACSWELHHPSARRMSPYRRPYGLSDYEQNLRVPASALTADAFDVAGRLVLPLTRVSVGEGWDPFGPVRASISRGT